MRIGLYELINNLFVAPMAGVTDRPFRQLCKSFGAGLAVSEMISSNLDLAKTKKTRQRMNHDGELEPKSIQIAGADPEMMAQAARFNVDKGAQIIDINMGCPAKKVCNKIAGSALLKDESLVARILEAVVKAVDVPVTLKIRTGWDCEHRNATTIAKIAEDTGVQALAIHGRTRACRFQGEAEYDTIKTVKNCISIPVIANGDVASPQQAKRVLEHTGADGIMVGRAAQGRPWLFGQIRHYLETGEQLPEPTMTEKREILLHHLTDLYDFYGESLGVRVARKHISWYIGEMVGGREFFRTVSRIDDANQQFELTTQFFDRETAQFDLAA
ncbi:MAG: tRNA dihydrouridine synthase DusB [Gammaproteobacteria bacterium]|nr:tRNA dihydrouridine synthase DusB [Gammaproteobacteria bacterium]